MLVWGCRFPLREELLVVADADEVAGLAGGVPGDVEPAVVVVFFAISARIIWKVHEFFLSLQQR